MARHLISGDKAIKGAQPGVRRLNDGDGLYLLLFVKGGAHGWRFDYTLAGRRKTLSLGTYPDTGLAAARRKADEARQLVAEGTDPSDVRKAAKAQQRRLREAETRVASGLPPLGSFEAVARDWLSNVHRGEVSEGHADRTRIRLEQNVFPWLGGKSIAEIKAPELLECLRRVEARGAFETAHRVKYACGQVFRYGIAVGACERDPTADLRDALAPVAVQHHAAITDPRQVSELMRAIDGYKGHFITRCALQLAPLLFQRPGELRRAEWSEIDLDEAMWRIPSAKMKGTHQRKSSGTPHLVPLPSQAVAVLSDLQRLTGRGRYVFPSLRTSDRPMSDAAVNAALRRMGYAGDEMTGHGFRAMARTMLAERLNVDEAVIEAQLAHAVPDTLGRAYNRTEFVGQRRSMMQTWANYLDQLRTGGQIVELRASS